MNRPVPAELLAGVGQRAKRLTPADANKWAHVGPQQTEGRTWPPPRTSPHRGPGAHCPGRAPKAPWRAGSWAACRTDTARSLGRSDPCRGALPPVTNTPQRCHSRPDSRRAGHLSWNCCALHEPLLSETKPPKISQGPSCISLPLTTLRSRQPPPQEFNSGAGPTAHKLLRGSGARGAHLSPGAGPP